MQNKQCSRSPFTKGVLFLSVFLWQYVDLGSSLLCVFFLLQAIRALLTTGAGNISYPGLLLSLSQDYGCNSNSIAVWDIAFCVGPMKLFLLIQGPFALNMPPLFLLKRDFRFNKKVCYLSFGIVFGRMTKLYSFRNPKKKKTCSMGFLFEIKIQLVT